MEVHHPHHPSHKKKWLEYLLEFFMLFLAVFLGFLAENIREHKIEWKKGRYLIESLRKDLENDTALLTKVITNMALHNGWIDSAVTCLNGSEMNGKEKIVTSSLFNATIWVSYTAPDIAMSGIRNSGAFNFIENDTVKKAILKHVGNLNSYIKYSEPLGAARHAMDTSLVSILSIRDLRTLTNLLYGAFKKGRNFIDIADFKEPILFKTYNPSAFKRLAEKLEQLNYLENDMLGQYERLYQYDVYLLTLLKKEYPGKY